MQNRAVVVLDVGKTLAKLSLWDASGDLIARRSRANQRVDAEYYIALDTQGITDWLIDTLAEFASLAQIGSIIPVSHGAGAVVIRNGRLVCPPLDYEQEIPTAIRADYDRQRDAFADTGSPSLPAGLNLGAQLFWLENLYPELLAGDAIIMPWAQYWSWLLCGVPASELTSLGCHSDLWRPFENAPSRLAVARGWAQKLAPLRRAGERLGSISPQWAAQTGLPPTVGVFCGLHDSNAALYAARGFPEIAGQDATVVSTGTWFVAMRSLSESVAADVSALDERRDCLVNIDVHGQPVPSARFMGGREIELLTGGDTRQVDLAPDQASLIAAVSEVLDAGVMLIPTFVAGVGPFPEERGRWINMPTEDAARRAAVCLYIALVLNEELTLLGTRKRLLIEGRFARSDVIVRALATLRPDIKVYVARFHSDVSYGALRLLDPHIIPPQGLSRVMPLDDELETYCQRWQREVQLTVNSPQEGL